MANGTICAIVSTIRIVEIFGIQSFRTVQLSNCPIQVDPLQKWSNRENAYYSKPFEQSYNQTDIHIRSFNNNRWCFGLWDLTSSVFENNPQCMIKSVFVQFHSNLHRTDVLYILSTNDNRNSEPTLIRSRKSRGIDLCDMPMAENSYFWETAKCFHSKFVIQPICRQRQHSLIRSPNFYCWKGESEISIV